MQLAVLQHQLTAVEHRGHHRVGVGLACAQQAGDLRDGATTVAAVDGVAPPHALLDEHGDVGLEVGHCDPSRERARI